MVKSSPAFAERASSPRPLLRDDDIRRVVSSDAFHAGRHYQQQCRVRDLLVHPDGSTIEASVIGTRVRPYVQTISLGRTRNGSVFAAGACSCPVGINCKHVAAVLFQYQAQAHVTARPAPTLPSPRSLVGFSRLPGRTEPPTNTADTGLSPDVEIWLRTLEAAQVEESENYPPSVRKRLLYVLDRGQHSAGLMVSLQSVELKRDGTPSGPATRLHADQLLRGYQPKFLRPSDRSLLRRLVDLASENHEAVIAALRSIFATGRGRWAAWDGPVLTEGPPTRGDLQWRLSADGSQRPELILPQSLMLLRLANPWYVHAADGVMGPVDTDLPTRVIRAMLGGPALPPAAAERVREEMQRRWPALALPTPQPTAQAEILQETLQPHLLLFAGELPLDPAAAAVVHHTRVPPQAGLSRVALARLSWQYGPISIPNSAAFQPDHLLQHKGALFRVARDRAAESQATATVGQLGLTRVSHTLFLPAGHPHAADLLLTDPDPAAWLELMLDDIPRLREMGWDIEIDGSFPWRLIDPSGDPVFAITERSGLDWFDLDLGMMVEGRRISLIPPLLDLIAKLGLDTLVSLATPADAESLPLLLPLQDGRLLRIPLGTLQPILAPLLELFVEAAVDEGSGTLRLSRRNAGDLALLEAAGAPNVVWSGGERIRALGRQLRDHGGIPPCKVPDGFGTTLRGYQQQGLDWLQFLRTAGLGGVLADDMGLGKTVQALAHLAAEQAQGRLDLPALVICPTSLVANWLAEATRFAPRLKCLVLHGPDRATRFAAIAAQDLVVTTYPLLARDHAVLAGQDWHVVILDEAQTIKNPLAATSKLARTLRARQRLCLSGTPLENHLGELWSLFDFLMPGLLGERKQFGTRYRGPIEKAGNIERRTVLAQRVAPFLLRRTKAQVAADLPPKTEIAEIVEMGAAQHAIYEAIRLAMHAKVRAAIAQRGLAGSGIIILDALLKLRQVCCDPRLLKLQTAKAAKAGSAKLERLLELLPAMLEDGRRVLLFSQFTSMLALIEAELARRAIAYVQLTGQTKDRATPMRQFQAGKVPLFLISLKAGGVGLNLTAADTVIHYDPWWNPAVENQATDRAHRIGQDKKVFVHRLITTGTIEEKMQTLKQRKQALADGILGGSAAAALSLTEDDLNLLFGAVS